MENSHYGNIGSRELLIVINRSSGKRKSNRIFRLVNDGHR